MTDQIKCQATAGCPKVGTNTGDFGFLYCDKHQKLAEKYPDKRCTYLTDGKKCGKYSLHYVEVKGKATQLCEGHWDVVQGYLAEQRAAANVDVLPPPAKPKVTKKPVKKAVKPKKKKK